MVYENDCDLEEILTPWHISYVYLFDGPEKQTEVIDTETGNDPVLYYSILGC